MYCQQIRKFLLAVFAVFNYHRTWLGNRTAGFSSGGTSGQAHPLSGCALFSSPPLARRRLSTREQDGRCSRVVSSPGFVRALRARSGDLVRRERTRPGPTSILPRRRRLRRHWSGTAPAAGWFSNATVYHVTNLNDSGAGSLRGAFQENSTNKIIVFDVAGTINLTTDNLDIKNLSNYYIAGQTAPGPVTVYGDMTQLTHSGDKKNRNVVLRYMSFRKGTGDNADAITFAGSGLGTNMILDHVSGSWSEDEILSVANNNTNVTVQYSMIHDALVNNHAYGSLIRPRIDSNVTFHHNLYANNASRQARFGTY